MAYQVGQYDREHGVLVWGGSLPGLETWSNSLRIAETEDVVLTNDAAGWDVQELLDHYTVAIKAFHQRAASGISPFALLQYVKFNRVDIDGHYIDPNTFINTFTALNGGGTTTNTPPNQISHCITTTTAVSRGPACRGRFFLPLPTTAIDNQTGLIPPSTAATIAASVKTFLELVADTPGLDTPTDPGPCVMSRKSGAAATRRISGIAVGLALDTQRRRRRNLKEQYVTATIDQ